MQRQVKTQAQLLSSQLHCEIREDESIEGKLRQKLVVEYAKLRVGIHVSDLTLCMRQSLFRKLDPKPPTTKQVGYFLDGARRHEALQALYGEGVVEKKGEFEGVRYSIDIYDGLPIEFKTTRARTAISEHWIRQLVFYMLATDSAVGLLQVQRIMPRDENPFPAYVITLDDRQKAMWLRDFRDRSSQFLEALEKKNPSLLAVYRGDGDWVCRECPYKSECDRMESPA